MNTKRIKKTVMMLAAVCCLSACADNAPTWNCGAPNAADVTAKLSGNTLTIKGKGEMVSYAEPDNYGWYSSHTTIMTVVIKKGVTSIGSNAFKGFSGLTSITIPNSVKNIGEDAFDGCSSLTSVTIPNNVTSIEMGAFSDCSSLTSVNIGDNVTSIGTGAFSGCSGLTSVTIPNSVTSIEMGAFSGCSGLTSVNIPNSVTSIKRFAFSDCGLTSVTIGNNITSIDVGVFSDCRGLTSVTCLATAPPMLGSFCFGFSMHHIYTVPEPTRSLYVPASSLNDYKNNSSWNSNFETILAI